MRKEAIVVTKVKINIYLGVKATAGHFIFTCISFLIPFCVNNHMNALK